ncbi:MAG: hypothetical protein ACYTDE_10895, partial [Planctomycetota bacterium]
MFGIESGVKLGRKIVDVLVDGTVERPLLLPVGDLYADVTAIRARRFFDRHPELTAAATAHASSGPYHGYSERNLVLAYKTLRSIDDRLAGPGGDLREATEIVTNLGKFEQYRRGFGSRPAVQRILGTVVEIGVDYFAANPQSLGRGSRARRIVHAFISELDETDFAEGSRREIVGDLLTSALHTLDANLSLIDDDERTRAVLGGIVQAILADIDALTRAGATQAALGRREVLLERIGSSVLRGAANAFTENINLFVRDESTTRTLVAFTLTQVLTGLEGREDILTNESLELIYTSALETVAENSDLLSDNAFVAELIGATATALAGGKKVFGEETVGAVLQAALDVVADHAEMLVDPDNPREQFLATAVGALAGSLST